MSPLSRLGDLARRQHRTITGAQLSQLGYGTEAVRHLVRTGRLWRVHRGVYALEGPLEPIGHLKAAELAGGERCMARAFSAAALLELRTRWPLRPQILIATDAGARGPRGVDAARSTTLRRRDVVVHRGVRTTSVLRTIRDCAPHLDPPALKALLREAEYRHRTDLAALAAPGAPRSLRRLLDVYVLGSGLDANALEARFHELCARARVPLPERQRRLGPHRVDFVWPDLGLIVETDGRAAHERAIAFTDDRRRDRRLKAEGWTVIRFTWNEVEHDPDIVVAELRVGLRAWTRTSSTTGPTGS